MAFINDLQFLCLLSKTHNVLSSFDDNNIDVSSSPYFVEPIVYVNFVL